MICNDDQHLIHDKVRVMLYLVCRLNMAKCKTDAGLCLIVIWYHNISGAISTRHYLNLRYKKRLYRNLISITWFLYDGILLYCNGLQVISLQLNWSKTDLCFFTHPISHLMMPLWRYLLLQSISRLFISRLRLTITPFTNSTATLSGPSQEALK